MNDERVARLRVVCLDADACDVSFEPEGALVRLAKGDVFTVEVRGDGDGILEIDHSPDGISIWAWDGAATAAWDGSGRRLKI